MAAIETPPAIHLMSLDLEAPKPTLRCEKCGAKEDSAKAKKPCPVGGM